MLTVVIYKAVAHSNSHKLLTINNNDDNDNNNDTDVDDDNNNCIFSFKYSCTTVNI